MDCIKGKHTNISKRKSSTRIYDVLEIVHTNISSPYDMCLDGRRYFISFIDYYSRYMYLCLLYDTSEALEAFEIYKVEVDKQLGKKIKIVKSYRGGGYYGRHTKRG